MTKRSTKEEYNNEFGKALVSLMKANKRNQGYIANICGVQRQTVSLWVLGGTRPDITSVLTIARHFNVSTDYLLGNNGKTPMDLYAYSEGYMAGCKEAIRLMTMAMDEIGRISGNG